MKLDFDKYSDKLKPAKAFFSKYKKTIYFVFIAIIIGFLMLRVTAIILKQSPAVDISEDPSVKGVTAIKHAKYDVYYDSLNYCYKTDAKCINTQILRLLTNAAISDNAIGLKIVPNNQQQFNSISGELKSIQTDLSSNIASGTYSDTIANINQTVRINKANIPNTSLANNVYKALTGASADQNFYANSEINSVVNELNNLSKNVIKPSQENITAEMKLMPALKNAVLKEQKANVNANESASNKYLVNNQDMPVLSLPNDTGDTISPSANSLYSILSLKPAKSLTKAESSLLEAVNIVHDNVKILDKAVLEYQTKSAQVIAMSTDWSESIKAVIDPAKVLELKDLKTNNDQEKAVLDRFYSFNKQLIAIKEPYDANQKLVEQFNKKLKSYIDNNTDDPTALKLLNPTLTDENTYNVQNNPFVN